MNYRLAPRAYEDLAHIDGWVASNFGGKAALRVSHELFALFGLLTQFPGIGHQRLDLADEAIFFLSHRQNWIIYEPGSPLVIHRVFPAAQDLKTFEL